MFFFFSGIASIPHEFLARAFQVAVFWKFMKYQRFSMLKIHMVGEKVWQHFVQTLDSGTV